MRDRPVSTPATAPRFPGCRWWHSATSDWTPFAAADSLTTKRPRGARSPNVQCGPDAGRLDHPDLRCTVPGRCGGPWVQPSNGRDTVCRVRANLAESGPTLRMILRGPDLGCGFTRTCRLGS